MIIHFICFMVIYMLSSILRIKHSNVFPEFDFTWRKIAASRTWDAKIFVGEIKIISNSNGRKERTKRDRAEESANYKHY